MLKEILLSSSILASSFIGGSPVYSNREMVDLVIERLSQDLVWNDTGNFSLDETSFNEISNGPNGSLFFDCDAYYVTPYISELDNVMFSVTLHLVACINGPNLVFDFSYFDASLQFNLIQPADIVSFEREIPLDSALYLDYTSTDGNNNFFATLETDINGDIYRTSTITYENIVLNPDYEPNSSAEWTEIISTYYDKVQQLLDENYEETQGLFGIIGDSVIAYFSSIGAMFTSIMSIFYYEEKLTFIGILLLIGFSIGIVKWAFNLVKRLVRK